MLSGAAKVAYHRRMNAPLKVHRSFDVCPVTLKPADDTTVINNMIIKTCGESCKDMIEQGLKNGIYEVRDDKLYKVSLQGMKYVQTIDHIVDKKYNVQTPHLSDCSCYVCTFSK